MYLVRCIYSYQYRTDLCSRPEGNVPGRYVCSPDSYVTALLCAHCDKSTGKGVNVVSEFGVGSCIVKLCISESILIGEFFTNSVQNVREGVVDNSFLGPDVLTCASVIGL